ncbi:MAG: LysM peptidoglycan-binding domain-containing protein [Mariprofundaceae bacterium]|nr:LysM peptidoglycan-binding domain-containing protein [Mariprofundaceae bacterium]
MKLQYIIAILLATFVFSAPMQIHADTLDMPATVSADDLRPNLPQPYIVKKGDTLWDIANYFFRDPHKWLKIWERNLYITNPDLIYPGNEIWFDARKQKAGGLTTVRPQPQVIIKPVERIEATIDPSLLLTALKRQDFIQPGEMKGVGHILDSEDERINYGANNRLYLRLSVPANEGDVFDIFRTGDPIRDPKTGKVVGVLVNHLGQIEITSKAGDVYRGVVLTAFEEISRGDRLKPAKDINTRITPSYPGGNISGQVLYIRNDAAAAGQNQVIGVDLGLNDGIQAGTTLSVHHAGRLVQDRVTGKTVRLPEEKIGELIILVPQKDASIALITKSTIPINIGDSVRNKARR